MMKVFLLALLLMCGCIGGQGEITPEVSPTPTETTTMVEEGDFVKVNYIGRLQDTGELFDTSYADIANNAEIPKYERFEIRERYGPLSFIVGRGQILEAFERGIVGMKEGEEKTITLSPDEAYGNWVPEFVVTSPRMAVFQRIEKASWEDYIRSMREEPVKGSLVNLTPYWPSEITDVSNNTVIITHKAINDSTVQTLYGPAHVTLNDSAIFMRLMPKAGSIVTTRFGAGKIIKVNESFVTVDFNHPLAGKTLVFEIKVEKIIKAREMAERQIDWIRDHELGLQKARTEGKPVIVFLYVEWCPWCQKLNMETFPDPRVTELKGEFVWVKVDAERNPDIAEMYELRAFPLLVFLESDGSIIKKVNRFLPAEELREEMDLILKR